MKDFIDKLAEALEVEASDLTPETNFRELDEWSSLAALSVIAMADEEYEKEISGSDLKKVNTVEELFELITSK